jgi:polysaccharide deacetylase family protein (PEP-CTERM system associated)
MNKNVMALSFDVEDWFTVRNMREFFRYEEWDQQELRIRIGLDFLLMELAKKNIKATFFILGWVADICPQIVRDIDLAGHEICSHGYSHTPLDLLTPLSFEEDLKKSIVALTNITGKKVLGYRAPSFSITKKTLWAIEILKRNGIEYDSSIFSIIHPDYGINRFPINLTEIGGILEVPLRKGKCFGANIPVCGGGYFRMLPYSIIKSSLLQTIKNDSLVMYFHPWEFDPEQPRIGLSRFKKFRHYVGLNSNRLKFVNLLNDFEFVTIEKMIANERELGRISSYSFELLVPRIAPSLS